MGLGSISAAILQQQKLHMTVSALWGMEVVVTKNWKKLLAAVKHLTANNYL